MACGFTNNVDLVVELDDAALARLVGGIDVEVDGPRRTRAGSPAELVAGIVQCLAAGEGIDLPVPEAGTQAWLLERVQGRSQLGGTGAQAANTLAMLGFPVVVHLTGCSPEQAASFERPALVQTTRTGGVRPLEAAIDPAEPTMWHVVLEYPAGVTARLAGTNIIAPASNRVIVSHDPINAAFAIDPTFVRAVSDPALDVQGVLLSGYSQSTDRNHRRRVLDVSLAAVRGWRAAHPARFIHLELGALPDVRDLAEVVEVLGSEPISIGLNQDELRDLMESWRLSPEDEAGALLAMRSRLRATRIGLHTWTHAMTVTAHDPERERDALLFATLLASTRARTGGYPRWPDLHESLELLEPHPSGALAATNAAPQREIRAVDDGWLVAVPAPAVPRPAASVGLGDTFTAGVLAMQ